MSISDKIRELVSKQKIELKYVSSELGITPQGLNNALRNNSWKVETLEKIAQILGVDIKYFFNDKSNNEFFLAENSQIAQGDNIQQSKNDLNNELIKNTAHTDKEMYIQLIESQKKIIALHEATIENLQKKLKKYEQ